MFWTLDYFNSNYSKSLMPVFGCNLLTKPLLMGLFDGMFPLIKVFWNFLVKEITSFGGPLVTLRFEEKICKLFLYCKDDGFFGDVYMRFLVIVPYIDLKIIKKRNNNELIISKEWFTSNRKSSVRWKKINNFIKQQN